MASLFSRWAESIRSLVITPINAKDPALARLFDGGPVSSGVPVNEWNALTYSAVWAAVGQISSTVASLPLKLYKRLPDGGKEPFAGHRLYELLHDNPNPEMTSFIFREILQAHLLTWGNAFAEIERDGAGRPVAIWPIPPDRVEPVRDARDRVVYRVRGDRLGDIIIPAADMLHVPGLGFDGMKGYGVIHMARESIGLGLAAERFGGTFFGNGSTFGGFLSHPAKISLEARQNIEKSLEKHAGPSRAHRILLLQENMSFIERKGIPPNDAQFLETRLFQVQEVARWLRISPYKLGDLSRATFSNIESQAIEFYTDTIRPWLVRWEQEINRKLIAPLERRQQFVEFVIEGALRGDVASRYSAYAVGRQWGWLSADDIRALENMNPLPGKQGEIYLLPQNMVPADRIGEIIDNQLKPKPAPVAPPPAGPVDGQTNSLQRAVELLEARIPELTLEAEEARAGAAQAREALAASDGASVELRAALAAAEARVLQVDEARSTALTALALANEQEARTNARAEAAEVKGEALKLQRDGLQVALDVTSAERDRFGSARLVAEDARAQAEARVVEARAEVAAALTERDAIAAGMSVAVADAGALSVARAELLAGLERTEAARVEAEAKLTAAAAQSTALAADAEAIAAQHRDAEAAVGSLEARLAKAESALVELEAESKSTAEALDAARRREADQAVAVSEAIHGQAQAAGELAGVAEARDQALAAARDAEARITAGRGAMVSAHRALYQDAATRLIEREIDRITGARSSANKLRTVMGPFYDRHLALVTRDLVPLLRVHVAFLRRDEDPEALAADLAEQHVAQSRSDLAEVYEADADEFPTQLSQMIQRWRSRRTSDLAEHLMRREIEHG